MSDAIEQGQLEVERMLRQIAKEQGVKLKTVRWLSSTGDPPLTHILEVKGSRDWTEEKNFTLEQLTGFQTDNQMKVQVRMMVESIVLKVKKHEPKTDRWKWRS